MARPRCRTSIALLRGAAELHDDPLDPPPVRSTDPGDDYLIALAASTQGLIVTGDHHLLDLDKTLPVYTSVAFLALLDAGGH